MSYIPTKWKNKILYTFMYCIYQPFVTVHTIHFTFFNMSLVAGFHLHELFFFFTFYLKDD